jgi:hypothetical protein
VLEADGGGFWAQALNGEASQAAYTVWGSDGMVGASVAEAGGSGGFEFPSVEEMNTVLGMWKDRRTSIQQKQARIRSATSSLSQLASDSESQGYLRQARDSLTLLNNQHDSMREYIDNYIQKLTDATNAKQNDEENNIAALTSHSENTPQ